MRVRVLRANTVTVKATLTSHCIRTMGNSHDAAHSRLRRNTFRALVRLQANVQRETNKQTAAKNQMLAALRSGDAELARTKATEMVLCRTQIQRLTVYITSLGSIQRNVDVASATTTLSDSVQELSTVLQNDMRSLTSANTTGTMHALQGQIDQLDTLAGSLSDAIADPTVEVDIGSEVDAILTAAADAARMELVGDAADVPSRSVGASNVPERKVATD